jgi:hypothetical protein
VTAPARYGLSAFAFLLTHSGRRPLLVSKNMKAQRRFDETLSSGAPRAARRTEAKRRSREAT